MSDDIINELERFDDEFEPAQTIGLERLSDGEYTFDIIHAELSRTKKEKDACCRWQMRVVGGKNDGMVVENFYLLTISFKLAQLGADLVTLGLDADKWKAAAGRPFSKELPAALPKLCGVRFMGRKTTNPDKTNKDKLYHNLAILNKVELGKGGDSKAAGGTIPF